MGERRLNALLLLFMHKDVSIDTEKVVNIFSKEEATTPSVGGPNGGLGK